MVWDSAKLKGNQMARKYAYDKLAVGEHMFVAGQSAKGKVSQSARWYGRAHGIKFMCKSTDEGVYIFRMADGAGR